MPSENARLRDVDIHRRTVHSKCMAKQANPPGTADAADVDQDAVFAKMIALAVRNSVEDLHANGAFSDRQAPGLNRRIRGRVYEVLIAIHRGDLGRDDDPFTIYLSSLAGDYDDEIAHAALQGAVARAVQEFATAEAIDQYVARELQEVAVNEALIAFKTLLRLHLGEAKPQRQIAYWLQTVPSYWEERSAPSSRRCSMARPDGSASRAGYAKVYRPRAIRTK